MQRLSPTNMGGNKIVNLGTPTDNSDAVTKVYVDMLIAASSSAAYPATLTVAANNASTRDKAKADYLCDGTADDVEINAALQAVKASGGKVQLSAGTFNLAAPLYLEGNNDPVTSPTVALFGSGAVTTLLSGAANSNVVVMRYMPKPQMKGFSINVDGTGDAIKCVANTTGSNDRRGFWMGAFDDIFVYGSGVNAHSGWVMNLENPFRSVFRNIQSGNNIKNGIRLYANNPAFNAGNVVMMCCQMGLDVANGTGYKIECADAGGFINIATFIECDAIDTASGSTSSIGWHFKGSGTSYFAARDLLVLRTNVEQFNTCAKFEHSANVEFNANYVDTKNNGTVFDCSSDSVNNQLSVQYVYVSSGKTVSAMVDANTDALKPNMLWRSFARVEGGATLTMTKSAVTVLEKLYRDSDGSGVYPSDWKGQSSSLSIKDEGTEISRGIRGINFTGSNVTATVDSGGNVTVNIGSMGGSTGPVYGSRSAVNDQDYNVNASTDYLVAFTSLNSLRKCRLPDPTGWTVPQFFIVKDESGNAASANIQIECLTSGATIDGASAKMINTNFGVYRLYGVNGKYYTAS
jgi:hypothetical protein